MKTDAEARSQPRPMGRSFENSAEPLGARLLAPGAAPDDVVANRARAIGVLRKAEEFMRTANPAPTTEAAMREALELAATRCGVLIEDYDAMVKDDPELVELEREVLTAAR